MRTTHFPIVCALFLGCTAADPAPPGTVPPDPVDGPEVEGDVAAPNACGFADITANSGVDFTVNPRAEMPPGVDPELDVFLDEIAAGLVLADLDGDGTLDLFLPQVAGPNALYWGNGDGTFVEADAGDAVARPEALDAVASAADFDGDGLLDLVVMGTNTIALLRNLGNGAFADETEARGLVALHRTAGTTAWADYDGDGDLDLYAGSNQGDGSYPSPEALWRNDGDVFTNVLAGAASIDDEPSLGLHAIFSDMDDDGDQDLFVINDGGPVFSPSRLWENRGPDADGWRWTDRGRESDLSSIRFGMGAALVDLDGDGGEDLVASDIGPLGVFRRIGTWGFADARESWMPDVPTTEDLISWSVVPLDLDGDGRPGLLVTYGSLGYPNPPVETEQADLFLRPRGEMDSFRLEPSSVFSSPTTVSSRGAAVGDIDGDLVPDLVVGRIDTPTAVFRSACPEGRRLVIDLRDEESPNRFGIGARVTVIGKRVVSQEVRAGGIGSFSGSGPTLYFGVGDVESVSTVRVRWPDGGITDLTDVCVNCRITVTR